MHPILVAMVTCPHAVDETHALAATASATAAKAAEGITGLMDKNNDLITDIDALIARASRTHDLVKKINSPVAFQFQPEAFLILQPPPGQQVQSSNGTIQIDTLNIIIWRDSFFAPLPALVFYAGPVSDNSEDDLSTGDYIAVTMEPFDDKHDTLNLMWRLGQNEGDLSTRQPIKFRSQIYITRVGSQFELLTGTSRGSLGEKPENQQLHSSVDDGSLLFHVTPKTEYLVGGIPPNAFLALPDAGKYASYEVDYNLLLVNGELWSLWDYSQHSPVNFSTEFNHHDNAFENIWLPQDDVDKGEKYYSLSFDGSSYLKPARFVSETVAASTTVNELTLNIRLVSVNGLILFLYDESDNSSLEVAMVDGDITLVYNGNLDKKASMKVEPRLYDGLVPVMIQWSTEKKAIQDTFTKVEVGDEVLFPGGFSPLTTHAWMGGVKKSELKFPFVPRLTNESFRGCLNMELEFSSNVDLSEQSFIRDNYFSPDSIMKGISGTCLKTVSGTGCVEYVVVIKMAYINARLFLVLISDIMSCTKHRLGQSMDCPAQTLDLIFVWLSSYPLHNPQIAPNKVRKACINDQSLDWLSFSILGLYPLKCVFCNNLQLYIQNKYCKVFAKYRNFCCICRSLLVPKL